MPDTSRLSLARGIPAVLFLVLAIIPFVLQGQAASYYLSLGARFLIYALAASALNLLLGYAGKVSFGHALFMGLGVYSVAICSYFGVTSGLIQLLAGLGVTLLVALFVGAVSLRTQGIAFIMITLAFGQMGFYLFSSLGQFGGDDGMRIQATSTLLGLPLGSPRVVYAVSLVLLLALCAWSWRVRSTPFGMVLQGARQNLRRVRALGVPVFRYQLVIFVVSALLTSVAGFLLANLTTYASPGTLSWMVSGDLIVMVVLGGMRTAMGPVYGALVYFAVEELIKGYTDHWALVLGILVFLIAVFGQRGITGLFNARRAASSTPGALAHRKEHA